MAKKKNNTKLMVLLLSSFFVLVTVGVIVGVLVLDVGGVPTLPSDTSSDPGSSSSVVIDDPVSDPDPTPVVDPDPIPDPSPMPDPSEPPAFNRPNEMKAAFVYAGQDFLKSTDDSASKISSDIGKLIEDIESLDFNTIVINTYTKDGVIYNSSLFPRVTQACDPLAILIEKARASNLHVYVTYGVLNESGTADTLATMAAGHAGALDTIDAGVTELVSNYAVDALVLDNFYAQQGSDNYLRYVSYGSATGYNNYLLDSTRSSVLVAATASRRANRNVQVGALLDPVWANADTHEDGSKTTVDFEMLTSAYADVKSYIEDGLFDCSFIKMYTSLTAKTAPLATVASWWNDTFKDTDTLFYPVLASDKACTTATGWSSPDQLTKQAIELKKLDKFGGLSFCSLQHLVDDPQGSTTALLAYLKDNKTSKFILSELKITNPEKTTYTTQEPKVTFQGASDPTFEVLCNGEKVEVNENGYFSLESDLVANKVNTFVFQHKGKEITYKITREVKIIQKVSPTSSIKVDGGAKVAVEVYAYPDSTVTATLNGSSITLQKSDQQEDENADKNSYYVKYVGTFTAPSASAGNKSLGAISVSAAWNGMKESATGASVTVNAQIDFGKPGSQIKVTSLYAETLPLNWSGTLSAVRSPIYHPLPQGTYDHIVGEVQQGDGYKYYNLKSGKRVLASDVSVVSDQGFGDNKVKGMAVTNAGTNTQLVFDMDWAVPYSMELSPVSYSGTSNNNYAVSSFSPTTVEIIFDYTTSIADLPSFADNPMFSSGSWSSTTRNGYPAYKLTLKLRAGFAGYSATYSGSKLTLRFNTPTRSNAKILVDPGHSYTDPGATFPTGNESALNRSVASKLASALRNRGLSVVLADQSAQTNIASRVALAQSNNCDIYLSVHHNAASNTSAKGPSTFYFTPFSQPLSSRIYSNLKSYYESNIYSASRASSYNVFRVNLPFQFASVLIEHGFVTNPNEVMYLQRDDVQNGFANATADAVTSYLSSLGFSSSYSQTTHATGSLAGVVSADQKAVDAEKAKYETAGVSIVKSVAAGTDITSTIVRLKSGQSKDSSITVTLSKREDDIGYLTVTDTAIKLAQQAASNASNNTAVVLVTLKKGSATASFTVPVTIEKQTAALLDKAELSALSFSTGTLSPNFAAGTTDYTLTVPYGTNAVNVTTATLPADKVKSISSGVSGSGISLSGSTITLSSPNNAKFAVTVIAENGTTTQSYTVTIIEAPPASPTNT